VNGTEPDEAEVVPCEPDEPNDEQPATATAATSKAAAGREAARRKPAKFKCVYGEFIDPAMLC
jgi:hypothetical protein